MTKYIFVSGGVVSGLGKGITAASLGRLLKARGYKVTMQKFDPYFNVDPGTMNPTQHGEVFVTDDGTETDLDLGHYERFIDENLDKNSNVTSGKIYWAVLNRERRGDYGGGTVQVIPHVTNEIKSHFFRPEETPDDLPAGAAEETAGKKPECGACGEGAGRIVIIEIGGTAGDIESTPFFEAIRQFRHEVGHENAIMIHVTLIPYLKSSQEMKTKPTQASVRELMRMGILPDILVCRTEYPLTKAIREKIALFCNVPVSHVIENMDAEYLYEVPLCMEREHLAEVALKCLNLPCPEPDLDDWEQMVEALRHPEKEVEIAVVGKYTQLHDSYLSVVEALKHGGIANHAAVKLRWVDSEEIEEKGADCLLQGADGILIPGGFGTRGTEGMIRAAAFAREHHIPFLGICLGMQMAIVSYARDVLGMADANSSELNPATTHPVIDLMPDQRGVENLGGTLRLGAWPCILDESSRAYQLFGEKEITERHRHRYEVNNDYREALSAAGMLFSGTSPDGNIVEMMELPGEEFYIGTQGHPELRSRPNRAHPLFAGLVRAAAARRN